VAGSPSRLFNVAVVGATGVVGQELLRVLAQRHFPIRGLKALASGRSAGGRLPYNGGSVEIEELTEASFAGIDVAFFAVGSAQSLDYAPAAVEAGALVIDKSGTWRMKENVPLVVPEVNANRITESEGIISVPNCCTIPLAMVVDQVRREAGVERVVVATYQSASGAGKDLLKELAEQTQAIAGGRRPPVAVYPHQLAYNVVPGGWTPDAEDYNDEEVKLVNESRKILEDPNLRVVATCVRVPVPVGHGEAVFIETSRPLAPTRARELLAAAPGIAVEDDPANQVYPTPAEMAGTDEVHVGRIRRDTSIENGLALWLVCDNLRKGAALNGVQIAEHAIEMGVIGK
jgi:aspartate-semialdehyde dehydrogenase